MASKFATGKSDFGKLIFGTSTTFSTGELPRTTRIVWV
jgi:hypothetical protein